MPDYVRLPAGVIPQEPAVGQSSVWSFPRPPVVIPDSRAVVITLAGTIIFESSACLKVLETSHPPTWYLPIDEFASGSLRLTSGSSFCEYKGAARYYDVVAPVSAVSSGAVAKRAAWEYPNPTPNFTGLQDHVALFSTPFDSVTVAGEQVVAQAGGFYGGWITSDVTGPFKGGPGTQGW